MTGIVPESWFEWSLGTGTPLQGPQRPTCWLAYGPITTNSSRAQQQLGKLVNQGRHIAQTPPLDQLQPETAHPPGPDDSLGRGETNAFAKA